MGGRSAKSKVPANAESQQSPISQPLPVERPPFVASQYLKENPPKRLPLKHFKEGEWMTIEPSMSRESRLKRVGEVVHLQQMAVVTYNIWFGTRMESVEEIAPRITGLMDIVQSKKPDIICLQGVSLCLSFALIA
jgi:hypothetical protein